MSAATAPSASNSRPGKSGRTLHRDNSHDLRGGLRGVGLVWRIDKLVPHSLSDILAAVYRALGLLFRLDPALLRIIALSLAVSFSAAAAASAVGLPLGAALAVARFRGRYLLIVLANAMFGLPPVVVGLGLYLLLSRYGPLGMLKMLFTPAAMILAQFLLALPIVVAWTNARCVRSSRFSTISR